MKRYFLLVFISIIQVVACAQDNNTKTYETLKQNMSYLIGEWTSYGTTFGETPYCFRITKSLCLDDVYYIEVPFEVKLVSPKSNQVVVTDWSKCKLYVDKLFEGDDGWGYGFNEPTYLLGQCIYRVQILKAGRAKKSDGSFMARMVLEGITKANARLMGVYVQYWAPEKHDLGECAFERGDNFVDPLQNVTIYSPDEDIRKLANAICVEKFTDYYGQDRLYRYNAETKASKLEDEMLEIAHNLRTHSEMAVDAGREVTILAMIPREELLNHNSNSIDLKKYFNDYIDDVIKNRRR